MCEHRAASDNTPPNGPDGDGKMDTPSPAHEKSKSQAGSEKAKKPPFFKKIWTKLDLDIQTVMMMFKGSLPPIIAIAAYQAPAWARHFGTLGYLVAIASILAFCIMPRGKFIQTLILNTLSICLAAAVNLLALFCAIKAREHTTPAGQPPTAYNSSASAVLAIWFLVQTYAINFLRAARPQFQFPAIVYSIFVAVAMTYGTKFPTMTYAISFMENLMEAFFAGFAIAAGVSLFIIPVSSRLVVFKQMTGYLLTLGAVVQAQTAYMQSIEDYDPRGAAKLAHEKGDEKTKRRKKAHVSSDKNDVFITPEAKKLQELVSQVFALHTKLPGDITFAKREIAIGKLCGHDIAKLWKLLQAVMIPVVGLTTIVDILRRRIPDIDYNAQSPAEEEAEQQKQQVDNVQYLMKSLHQPFETMSADMNAAIQHILITLELIKPPKKKKGDEESEADLATPGSAKFAEYFKTKLDEFYESKKQNLRDWCQRSNIELPPDFFESTFVRPENVQGIDEHARERHQRQLFVVLHLDYLLWRAGSAALELVLWADQKKQDGTLKKTRLIVPPFRTIRRWVGSVFGREDSSQEDQYTAEMDAGSSESLDLGESFSKRKDPEHLPPRNAFEKFGNFLRVIPHALRSDASAFGLRVSAATMSIAIVCYLEASQQFFLTNRLLWAMIMVSISMSRTAGQSIANYLLRTFGTVVAMIGSYIIWYIVVGHTAGVIVFLWLWIFLAFYVVLKIPKLIIVGILSLVTAILIIGYELEVQLLGKKIIESNGQPAYPTYLLAPYRLATVAGGLAVAFIWTIFPYPISESTELRKDLGASLYLMANFYSVVHETVMTHISQRGGDPETKGTRAYHLEKARNAVLSKLILLVSNLRMNSAFSRFQVSLGGRFPREEYEGLIASTENLLRYCTLLSYASTTFSAGSKDSSSTAQWSSDFRHLLMDGHGTTHQVTSLLSLLSSSLLHGRALPPYLAVPPASRYQRRLNKIDPDILSIRHMAEPEYSAFAVIQICGQSLHDELVKITKHVKTLVGEIDFTFHVVSTENGSEETLRADQEKKLDALDD